jgi:hypothetical protein
MSSEGKNMKRGREKGVNFKTKKKKGEINEQVSFFNSYGRGI